MNRKKRVLFLYTELAGYFISSIRRLAAHEDVEIHIFRYPINEEAPFIFDMPSKTTCYERTDLTTAQVRAKVKEINPDFIYSSGWVDKGYLSICKDYFGKIPVVLAFDNQWSGTLKQYLATFVSPAFILNRFSYVWVPGSYQYEYARKLGFEKEQILEGVYSADVDYFDKQYLESLGKKKDLFPKRFVFFGRYIKSKGIEDLCKAFVELQQETPNDWELWCFGTGDLAGKMISHQKIVHHGFIQQNEIGGYLNDAGVYVMPSRFEPWGVAMHEFASAGYPIVASNACGASTAFLKDGFNGYSHEPGDVTSLKEAMSKIISHSDEELLLMGKRSNELAKTITSDTWVDTVLKLINER